MRSNLYCGLVAVYRREDYSDYRKVPDEVFTGIRPSLDVDIEDKRNGEKGREDPAHLTRISLMQLRYEKGLDIYSGQPLEGEDLLERLDRNGRRQGKHITLPRKRRSLRLRLDYHEAK